MKPIVCEFCQVFGREDGDGNNGESARKRKKTTNVKYYSAFRADYYKTHLTNQHPLKWSEYQKINDDSEAISKFFCAEVSFVNTLDAHLEVEKPLSFAIDKNIVEKIIGNILFDPEDEDEELSKECTLSLFKINDEGHFYQIEIKNARLFRLYIRFISCGSTIRLSSLVVQVTQEETNLAYLSGASETKIRQYVRVSVVICLQNISNAMKSSWTYSIALDASTYQSSFFPIMTFKGNQ